MATPTTFSAMLNDYLPNELLKEEFIKRDWLLSNVEKDDGWVGAVGSDTNGGQLIVPFKAAGASSVSWGALTASSDVAEDLYVRGKISTQPELWGTMIFNHRDIMEHNKVSEKNFLKVLPGTIEDFMDWMKNVSSVSLLNGTHFAKLTATGTAGGLITVDRPDRFVIGQKVSVDDDDSGAATGYVVDININTKVVHLQDARSGGADVSCTAYTVAQNAKVYHPGSQASGFSSLRAALLSSANGGSATLYGVTKTTYPYTQSINVSGADITAVNIMSKIFDALTTIRQFGKGNPTKVLMSYTNFASCLKVIEASKGGFNVSPGSQKASQYGWTEIEVGSVTTGGISLTAVQEADDDIIMFLDMRGVKFYSNGFFKKRVSPDGTEYFEVRNTTGYQYLIDICLFGDIVVTRPSYQGILYSISY